MKPKHDGSKFEAMGAALVASILEGAGELASEQRRAAFTNAGPAAPIRELVGKVAARAAAITDDDFLNARRAGYTEDELFEVVVCAAVGEATRQYERALQALRATTKTEDHASDNPR